MTQKIETLDIQDFTSRGAASKAAFVEKLGQAFHDIGFVVISGHKLNAEKQKKVYEKIQQFFSLPTETKRKYEVPGIGGARGYTTFGKEHAKDHPIGDLKEFFHVGMELPDGHPLHQAKEYHPNVSVAEIEDFDDTLRDLYRGLLSLGTDLLQAIALYLKQPEHFFDEYVQYGNSVLRPIHYPPLTGREEPGAVRSAAHEDINLITLLIGASSPGLEVKSRKGEWIPIVTGPTEIVVNVGDMLQRLTNYQLVSTTHRVVNPPRTTGSTQQTRFSVPFFLHPVSQMSLKPLASCVDPQHPPRDPATTAGEYLTERLREIGLT